MGEKGSGERTKKARVKVERGIKEEGNEEWKKSRDWDQ